VQVAGTVDPANQLALVLTLATSDLAAADDLAVRLRRSLGTPDAMAVGLSGRGSFRGRCDGTLSNPVFSGRFVGRDVGYLGVNWGDAEWAGRLSPYEFEARSLVARRAGAELWLDGRLDTGDYGDHDGLDLELRVQAWPAEDLARALRSDLEVGGATTGRATVRGRRSAPLGTVRLSLPKGTCFGVPFEGANVTALLRGRTIEVPEGSARVGAGIVRFRGAGTDDEAYDVLLRVQGVPLSALVGSRLPALSLDGQASGDLELLGSLRRPRVRGTLRCPSLRVGGVDLGVLRATVHDVANGRLDTRLTCQSHQGHVTVEARIGSEPTLPSEMRATVRNLEISPWLRLLLPGLPSGATMVASGRGTLSGPLGRPADITLEAEVSDLLLQMPDYPLRNRDPLRLALRKGRLELDEVRLSGEGTHLECLGAVDLLTPDGMLGLSLEGVADLRALSGLSDRIRGRGTARLHVAVAGTRRAPQLDGSLDIEGAGLRFRGFPQGLDEVTGHVSFTESGARVTSLRGRMGGGTVAADGDLAFAGGRLATIDLRANGHGIRLRYPQGLRSTVEGDLRLAGDAETQWVTGEIVVRQALWSRRYDIASDLFARPGSLARPAGAEGPHVSFDVRVRAPGTVRVDNNLATLDARADLRLVGTLEAPVLMGHADIERGRVYFRGSTYVIRRGTIEFTDPQRTDPFFDIEAETAVRGYRVVLSVGGTLDRVHPTLTSDPPLSPLQILTLLAGGDESAVASLTQAQRDQAYLAVTGAATLAAGRLSETMGLERGAQLLGLSRFSIDPRAINPALAEGEASTAARLTVGKRLTPDLVVLYAQDLGGRDEHLISVEYTLSDRVSLLLTRNQRPGEEGEYGFDVLLRHSK
jgi:autotransporter translocation and assembly factor TamB